MVYNIFIKQLSFEWLLCKLMSNFITASKRSLGQGNVFTCVCYCHSVHGSGVSVSCPFLSAYPGGGVGRLPTPEPEKWAVCILLECCLGSCKFFWTVTFKVHAVYVSFKNSGKRYGLDLCRHK